MKIQNSTAIFPIRKRRTGFPGLFFFGTVILLLLVCGFLFVNSSYKRALSEYHSGNYDTAERLFSLPAKLSYSDAKDYCYLCDCICTIRNGSAKKGIQHLYRFLRDKHSPAAMLEASRIIVDTANNCFACGKEKYFSGTHYEARWALELAAEEGVPDAETYCLLNEAALDCSNHYYVEALEKIRQAAFLASSDGARTECKRLETEAKQKKQAWEPEYLNQLKTSLPYCGMSEAYISKTYIALQYPHKYYALSDASDAGPVLHEYRYYSGSNVIFSVECEDGIVTEVSDMRYKLRNSPRSADSKHVKSSDPLHASDYEHPEDFYEWEYDEFWDYEEAEDYWEEFN